MMPLLYMRDARDITLYTDGARDMMLRYFSHMTLCFTADADDDLPPAIIISK